MCWKVSNVNGEDKEEEEEEEEEEEDETSVIQKVYNLLDSSPNTVLE